METGGRSRRQPTEHRSSGLFRSLTSRPGGKNLEVPQGDDRCTYHGDSECHGLDVPVYVGGTEVRKPRLTLRSPSVPRLRVGHRWCTTRETVDDRRCRYGNESGVRAGIGGTEGGWAG